MTYVVTTTFDTIDDAKLFEPRYLEILDRSGGIHDGTEFDEIEGELSYHALFDVDSSKEVWDFIFKVKSAKYDFGIDIGFSYRLKT